MRIVLRAEKPKLDWTGGESLKRLGEAVGTLLKTDSMGGCPLAGKRNVVPRWGERETRGKRKKRRGRSRDKKERGGGGLNSEKVKECCFFYERAKGEKSSESKGGKKAVKPRGSEKE